MGWSASKPKARDPKTPSFKEYFFSLCKSVTNPVTMGVKSFVECLTDMKQPNHLNNLFNPNMNNVQAIDYTNHHLTSDLDGVLPRWSCEFPRISSEFKSKADVGSKPWGNKSDPVYVNLFQDSTLTQLHSCNSEHRGAFQKGVWYYSGMPLTDHHDLAGFENHNRVMQTWLGTEYRPQMYINIFNRLLLLDFTPSEQNRQPLRCC